MTSVSSVTENELSSTHIFSRTELVSRTTNILNCVTNSGQLYSIVYSSISAIHTNLIIRQQLINNNSINNENHVHLGQYDKNMIKTKNYKYKQLIRRRYCDYINKVNEEDRDSEE